MKTSSVEIRNAKASVTVPMTGTFSVSSVVIRTAAGRTPEMTISGHEVEKGKVKVIPIDDKSMLSRNAEIQAITFRNRTEADSEVTIEDGAGGTLVVKGLMRSPETSLGIGHVSVQFGIMHELELLRAYRPDVYPALNTVFASMGPNQTNDILRKITGPVASRLQRVNALMRSKTRPTGEFDKSPYEKMLQESFEGINAPLAAMFEAFLAKSAATTAMAALEDDDDLTLRVARYMESELLSSAEGADFWATFEGILTSFGLLFVPGSRPGADGLLIRHGDVVEGAEEELTVPVETVSFHVANRDYRPITHVVVRGPAELPVLEKGNTNFKQQPYAGTGSKMRSVAVYPDTPFSGGAIHEEPFPVWLPTSQIAEAAGPALKDYYSLEEYDKNLLSVGKYLDKVNSKHKVYLDDLARQTYLNMSLAGYTCSLSIPLNVNLVAGQRFKVMSKSGAHMFTGFLAAAEHTLKKSEGQDGGGLASTNLTFTHVMSPSFELPT